MKAGDFKTVCDVLVYALCVLAALTLAMIGIKT